MNLKDILGQMSWKEIVALAASVGTLASPIDILPETILGPLGFGDDAIAVVVAGFTLYKAVKAYRAAHPKGGAAGGTAQGAPEPGPQARPDAGGKGPRIIVDPPEPGSRK